MAQCTATVRKTGQRCRRRAVTGYPVCQVHGAGSPKKGRPGGRPIETGLHSNKLPERMREKFLEARSDPELLNLRDSLALLDSRLEDILIRVDTGESGAAWTNVRKAMDAFLKEFYDDEGKHVNERLDDLKDAIQKGLEDYAIWSEVINLLEQRRKIVESEQKRLVAMQQVITISDAMVLMTALANIVKKHVVDRQVQLAITTEFINLTRRQKSLQDVGDGTATSD